MRSLVELHQGTVIAASDGPGQGSQFVVRLPLVATAQGPDREETHEANGSSAEFSQRVLVVDDNVDSATTLALMLKAMGHRATVAHDGPSAVEIAQTFGPTLILLDIGLPGMNGYAVAQRLRTIPTLRGVTLAALTGYGEDQDRRRSREAGFDLHFVKPVRINALQELIGSLPKAMDILPG